MKAVIFTPNRNLRNVDFTGAFRPESANFSSWLQAQFPGAKIFRQTLSYDMPGPSQESMALTRIREEQPDVIAFFMHGYGDRLFRYDRRGLFRGDDQAAKLGRELHVIGCETALFYCCSMAGGSWCQQLSAAAPNLLVAGHRVAGHTTKNSTKTVYRAGQEVWRSKPADWRRALKVDPNLRFSFWRGL